MNPIYFVTSPEPAVMLVTPPPPPAPLTLAMLQDELNGYEMPTPAVVDRLNALRESYRAAMRDIAAGKKQPTAFPLWDATIDSAGRTLGFFSVFVRLNRCAERLGLIKHKFGYRLPITQTT